VGENNPSFDSDRRLVTVMFADISGFTSMSEKMDPEMVTDIMNECFCFMGECIEKHGGTIDKFIGDCVMALFGALKTLEDAPHRAIETALEMKNKLIRFNEDKRLLTPLSFHIGINTGPVIAGMVGSDLKQDFTVMGDTVNLASRMEGAAETGTILVAENTYRLTEGYFDFEPMGEVKVKGKEEPIKAYKVLGPRRTITRIEACQEKGLSPFVGRNKELDHLNDRLEQVLEGHGQVVGVVGEPGVGKSRLVCQFRESLPPAGYTVIEGGCVHFGDTIPYLPILDMLRDYFHISEDETEATIKQEISNKVTQISDQLTHIFSPIQEILSLKVENEEYVKLDAKQRRDKVFEAIRMLLIAESQQKPLVVIIEDLHWMDKTSEEFLTYLINSLATTRILLILLFRPEYHPSWSTKTYYSQVRVDQFPRKVIEDHVKGILACVDVEPELIEFIANKTEGNPLFIEELTLNLLENGAIKQDGNRYSLSLKPTDIQVPATIQGIIAARLDRLEGKLKGIMQTASVIGREFAVRLLQAVAILKEDLKSSLLTLQDLEFIYEKSFLPELEYIFKHALTQEVAYNSLLLKRRKETHEKVGQAIEQIYADRLEEFYEVLAYHYSLGENTQKAYEYLKFSGDKAARSYANWEAVKFYKNSLDMLDTQQESEEVKRKKLKVCQLTINPLFFSGYPESTLEILQKGEKLAQELGDERILTILYSRLSHYHTLKANLSAAMDYSEKCFTMAEKIESINLMALSADQVINLNWVSGDHLKVVDTARRIFHVIEGHLREKNLILSGINMYAAISGYCGSAFSFLGMFAEGKATLDKGLQIALDINDKYDIAWIKGNYVLLSFLEGNTQSTLDNSRDAIKYVEEASLDIFVGIGWSLLGSGYYLSGEYERAKDHAEKGLMLAKNTLPALLPFCCWILALIHLAQGDLEQARENAEEALRLSQEYKTKAFEGLAWIAIGWIMGKAKPTKIDEALIYIQHGISLVDERELRACSALGSLIQGELFANAGRKEEALEHLKKAETMYLEMKITPKSYWLKRTQEALAKLGQVFR
jgi:class 3 adenylate cyclase/tetratricopeptide (TPR) repeat protein